MYGLVSLNVNKEQKTLSYLDASNLSAFLKSQKDVKERSFYLYGNNCQHVAFKPPLAEDIKIDEIRFSKKTKAFWFDNYGTLQEKEFAPIKYDHFLNKVCLKFDIYENRSTSALVIQSGNFYYYASFFKKSESFSSLEEARLSIINSKLNPKSLRVYR